MSRRDREQSLAERMGYSSYYQYRQAQAVEKGYSSYYEARKAKVRESHNLDSPRALTRFNIIERVRDSPSYKRFVKGSDDTHTNASLYAKGFLDPLDRKKSGKDANRRTKDKEANARKALMKLITTPRERKAFWFDWRIQYALTKEL